MNRLRQPSPKRLGTDLEAEVEDLSRYLVGITARVRRESTFEPGFALVRRQRQRDVRLQEHAFIPTSWGGLILKGQ